MSTLPPTSPEENPEVINNIPEAPGSGCVRELTTDQQYNVNLVEAVKTLIQLLQDGTIPVKNSDRLQNLTPDDLVKFVKDNIDLPDLFNHIITNENNEIINVIQQITSHNTYMDTKFVVSPFVKFKVITEKVFDPTINGMVQKKFIEAHLPKDILNEERIVNLFITTTNDENINLIENEALFEYSIWIDGNDPQFRLKVKIPADKLDLGKLQTLDVNNLPSNPEKWGTFGIEKYIKVIHLVDTNWLPVPLDPTNGPGPTPEDQFDVAKAVVSLDPIPMVYGNADIIDPITGPRAYSENIHFTNTALSLIKTDDSNQPIEFTETVNVHHPDTWLILKKDPTYDDGIPELNDLHNFFKDPTRIVLQDPDLKLITNFADNISLLNPVWSVHNGPDTSEITNVFVMPPNKIISQGPLVTIDSINGTGIFGTSTQNKEEYINFDKTGVRVINEILNNVIKTKVSTFLTDQFSDLNTNSDYNIVLMRLAQNPVNETFYIKKFYVPDYIIVQIVKEILNLEIFTNYYKEPTRIIEFKSCIDQLINYIKLLNDPHRIINQLDKLIFELGERSNFYKEAIRIIEQETLSPMPANGPALEIGERSNFYKEAVRIIEQLLEYTNEELTETKKLTFQKILSKKLPEALNIVEQNLMDGSFITNPVIDYSEEQIKPPAYIVLPDTGKYHFNKIHMLHGEEHQHKIINQLAMWPASMVVTSGSTTYLQNITDLKVISSLANNPDMVPLLTAEDQKQRNTYEYIAEQNQRVFDLETNPYDTTVYREGMRLSRGDYYVTGQRIILKVPANAGEVITIVSERRYTYSNNVSKDELANALNMMKAPKPIISYPALTYELATIQLKIENYNPSCLYDIQVRYEGQVSTGVNSGTGVLTTKFITGKDIAFARNTDTIYLDIPEIVGQNANAITVIVYATIPGKIQSLPTTATIQIKNLYDYAVGEHVKRLVIGTTPQEWYGEIGVQKINFTAIKNNESIITELAADTNGPIRIGIEPNNFIQSNLIDIDTYNFDGTYLDSFIGLENLNGIKLPVLQTNGSESVLGLNGYTQSQIEEAFKKNKLWIITDASTENNINNDFIKAVNGPSYGVGTYVQNGVQLRYTYRPAQELMLKLNLLPKDSNSIYLEHIDKLKGRFLRGMMILDIDFRVDYDFQNKTSILNIPTEDNAYLIPKYEIPFESISYKVQEGVPHLLVTINNTEITNINNPHINESSHLYIPMITENLNKKQLDYSDPDNVHSKSLLKVNNFYGERTFSGLPVDMAKPEQTNPFNLLKGIKRFELGPMSGYFTNFRNDYLVLGEEDYALTNGLGEKIIYGGMYRFRTKDEIPRELPEFRTSLKTFDPFLIKEKAFKTFVQTGINELAPSSPYKSDIALVQYGGYSTYLDDKSVARKVIDTNITFQRVYVSNHSVHGNFDIDSSVNPVNLSAATDGYHVVNGPVQTIRIPTIWDAVFRPSTQVSKQTELREIWTLLRDSIPLTDQRWLNITDGILEKGTYQIDTTGVNIMGAETRKDSEIINIDNAGPNKGFLMFGGIGYKPITKQRASVNLGTSGSYLSVNMIDPTHPFHADYAKLKWVWDTKGQDRFVSGPSGSVDTDRWRNRKDILNIRYGWENNEPYIEYSWARTWTVSDQYYGERYYVQFYVDRVSREKVINDCIYHVDTSFIDLGHTTIHSTPSHGNGIITKFQIPNYKEIYRKAGTIDYCVDPINDPYPLFQDIIRQDSRYWLTIKEPTTNKVNLYSMDLSTYPTMTTGAIWKKHSTLISPSDDPINPAISKWTLSKDVAGTLRGDGPILFKHQSDSDYLQGNDLNETGVYHWDTWENRLHRKTETKIPASSLLFGVPEVIGIRNPYFTVIDTVNNLNFRIDIVGARINIVIYLDKYISKLTPEEFNLFKENILHLDESINDAISANPNRAICVLPNDEAIKIRTIIPDNDDYNSNSGQIIFNRFQTQTGRPAQNLLFRLTNKAQRMIELDSIRFVTK